MTSNINEFQKSLEQFQTLRKDKIAQESFETIKVQRGTEVMLPIFNAAVTCGAFIAGGAVRWMCSNHPDPVIAMDVDIFPQDLGSMYKLNDNLLKLGYRELKVTPMSIDLINDEFPLPIKFVQLVKPRNTKYMTVGVENAEEQLKTLDFSVTRIVLTDLSAEGGTALADPNFLSDEYCQRLVIKHIVCPIASVKRLMK
jgi:hypothetical protein